MKVWPVFGLVVLQVFLTLGHWFIIHTIVSFWRLDAIDSTRVGVALIALSFTFVVAALVGFRYSNPLVIFIYTVASVWLGIVNYIFWAACLCWPAAFIVGLVDAPNPAVRPAIASTLFAIALLTSIFGLVNAQAVRLRRLTITLPNMPPSWRGRTALVASDLHLGNINGLRFARRIAGIARRLNPDILFIPGDLFDGSHADPNKLAGPIFELAPPAGIYFCGGNHEDFGDPEVYEAALRRAGIHVLHNRAVEVDGVSVIGVPYAESIYPLRFRAFLESLHLDRAKPSILLNHVPNRLPIVEQAGVALQLSGHTHGGQLFPFTYFTRRAFGKFTYGLHRFGKLQVLTSSGAGTWGPPMRVGSAPEVVLITFA
ncbi:MAG TPA: metallophosphoesterase [Terracidiphilus sp.]|nr:metallophosphoesterase [Terracidiphilus sp.]